MAKPTTPERRKAHEKEYLSRTDDDSVERDSEDSFPASDPPSYTPVTHSGDPRHGEVKKPE